MVGIHTLLYAHVCVRQRGTVNLCTKCTNPTVQFGRTCPHCQSPRTHLLQGHEMLIKEIEAVETGPTAPERA